MSLTKYVLIQDDPIYLPRVLNALMDQYSDTIAGVNIQQGGPTGEGKVKTAWYLLRTFGPSYFVRTLSKVTVATAGEIILNRLTGDYSRCFTVWGVSRKYDVKTDIDVDVNSNRFRDLIKDRGIDLVISISSTRIINEEVIDEVPEGVINVHGSLLPDLRGVMPTFWTLAEGHEKGGVTVHYIDEQVDTGPILVQKEYEVGNQESLDCLLRRSKKLATDALIEAIEKIESGNSSVLSNPPQEGSYRGRPKRKDVRSLLRHGHTLY